MTWRNVIRFKKTQHVEEINPPDPGAIKGNYIDKVIVDHGNTPTAQEIYKARWVWYHTILAIEIAFTNILLLILIVMVALK